MASDQWARLFSAINADEQLQQRFQEAADLDAFVAMAAELGYTIDASDVEAMLGAQELSDAELASASGGSYDFEECFPPSNGMDPIPDDLGPAQIGMPNPYTAEWFRKRFGR
ncbi:MAG TPA: Nif11-like leader peptide family RiPP precursor [Candidatus Nanopelagicales bacterium]|nr:Nif11-like leader peptide family RiPP precursor [Candidatus Nanopelagicales bacterium]